MKRSSLIRKLSIPILLALAATLLLPCAAGAAAAVPAAPAGALGSEFMVQGESFMNQAMYAYFQPGTTDAVFQDANVNAMQDLLGKVRGFRLFLGGLRSEGMSASVQTRLSGLSARLNALEQDASRCLEQRQAAAAAMRRGSDPALMAQVLDGAPGPAAAEHLCQESLLGCQTDLSGMMGVQLRLVKTW